MSTKIITFNGKQYSVPSWVSWVGVSRDGHIIGYQWEPIAIRDQGWIQGFEALAGQEYMIESPEKVPRLERV